MISNGVLHTTVSPPGQGLHERIRIEAAIMTTVHSYTR